VDSCQKWGAGEYGHFPVVLLWFDNELAFHGSVVPTAKRTALEGARTRSFRYELNRSCLVFLDSLAALRRQEYEPWAVRWVCPLGVWFDLETVCVVRCGDFELHARVTRIGEGLNSYFLAVTSMT
jgi:hypothetical protein